MTTETELFVFENQEFKIEAGQNHLRAWVKVYPGDDETALSPEQPDELEDGWHDVLDGMIEVEVDLEFGALERKLVMGICEQAWPEFYDAVC